MKHIVLIFSGIFFGVVSLGVVMTIYGEMNRNIELKSNFPSLIEEVLEEQMEYKIYKNHEEERFAADFAKKLASTWETKSDMIIGLMQFKPEQGILSLKVIAKYRNVFGGIEMTECERTVIWDSVQE